MTEGGKERKKRSFFSPLTATEAIAKTVPTLGLTPGMAMETSPKKTLDFFFLFFLFGILEASAPSFWGKYQVPRDKRMR